MTYQEFHLIFAVAKVSKTFDGFHRAWPAALNENPHTRMSDSPYSVSIAQLKAIFAFAQNPTFSTLRKISGLTQRAFAETYSVALRNVECWSSGYRNPTRSTLLWLAFAVISDCKD